MSERTKFYVKVQVLKEEVHEVYAVHEDEAREKAGEIKGFTHILEVSSEPLKWWLWEK